jgi:hypothetical protein
MKTDPVYTKKAITLRGGGLYLLRPYRRTAGAVNLLEKDLI